MALVRVAQYGSVPGPVTNYQAQNAHLQAFTNQLLTQQFILDSGTAQPVIKQGCYVSHGGSLYVADADTAITGSPSDGSVYIRVSGTTTLTVEFINGISGYTWNPVYSALTSGSYTLLPYLIVKASTVWTRYNFNPNNQFFGAIIGTSIWLEGNATAGGNLAVTGAISGATINTGQGATEVYLMNQNLRKTDSPTFSTLGVTGAISGASLGVDNLYNPRYIIYDGSKGNTDFKVINSQVGAYSIGSVTSDNAYITTSTYTKKREIVSKATGTVRVSHLVRTSDNRTVYTRVYVNGVAVGVVHQLVASSSGVESQTFTDDILVEYGDLVQIYGKVSVPSTTDTWVGNTNIMCNVRASL